MIYDTKNITEVDIYIKGNKWTVYTLIMYCENN